jgi:predicted exporter
LGNSEISRFILVEGKLQEDVLIKEEIFLKELRKLQHRGIIAQAIAISDFVPSRHRQEQKLALLRSAFLSDQQILEAWMRDIGFETQVYQNLMQRLQHSNPQWLTTEEWLSHPVSANLRHLWLGQTSRGYASIIILQGVTSEAPIAQIAQNHNGVHYIDTVRQITGLFQRQRQWATYFVIAAYLCILALLWMLSGLKLALLAMLPPVVAALFVLGIYGLLGLSFHLFHFLALLLVLGIGIDYGIFFAQPTLRRETTMLAVTLSAITSMLAFGLLSLSQTPALRAFGLTILLGIGLAWLISPLVSAQTSCKSQ